MKDCACCYYFRFGNISLQERINLKNFEILEAYYKLLNDKVPLECKSKKSTWLYWWWVGSVMPVSIFVTSIRWHSQKSCAVHLMVLLHCLQSSSYKTFISTWAKKTLPLVFACRPTVFPDTDWYKGITWNPGPECSHKEEEECGDTLDRWSGVYLYETVCFYI